MNELSESGRSNRGISEGLRLISAVFILLLFSISGIFTCQASTVWSENFDDGNLDGWTVTGTSLFSGARTIIAKGNFSANDKTLRATGTSALGAYSILTHPTMTTKGTWSWDLYFNTEGTKVGYTAMVTFADKSVVTTPLDWSAYGIQVGDSGTLTFMRYMNGYDTQIGRGKFISKPGSWTHIDLTRNEKGCFCLYADGNLSMNVTDLKISTFEYFGLWLVPGPAIDNVVVSDVRVISDVKIVSKVCNVKICVKDPSGGLLQGVDIISIAQPSSQIKLTGSTGADGTVTFTDVTPGDYSIQMSKTSYVTSTVQATIKTGNPNELTSTLQTQPSTSGGVPGFPYLSVIIGVLFCIQFYKLISARDLEFEKNPRNEIKKILTHIINLVHIFHIIWLHCLEFALVCHRRRGTFLR